VVVSALPPDRVLSSQQPNAPDPTRLNVYLYHVTRNAGWRNRELPARDSRGELVTQPLLPLDLHYLLTAYGTGDLQSEILLGYAMQVLHENPVLTRAALRRTLTAVSVSPQILPSAYSALRAADLADQFELVKITPQPMTIDEMSKVWTALQTHQRTSACYHASVVLIESRRPARSPLPVLTRGLRDAVTGREPGVFVNADLLPPVPTISVITPIDKQLAARMGERVDIEGHRLTGATVTARITAPREQQTMTLATTAGVGLVSIQVPTGAGQGGVDPTLGTDPDNWRCGLYDVDVRVQIGVAPPKTTNTMPMVLAPRIVAITAAAAGSHTTFAVQCAPRVRTGQNVSLIVGAQEIPGDAFAPPSTDTVHFRGGPFVPGAEEWVRLRVDGVDSLLVDRNSSPPKFSVTDKVVIP
jgi:hypothetical protein